MTAKTRKIANDTIEVFPIGINQVSKVSRLVSLIAGSLKGIDAKTLKAKPEQAIAILLPALGAISIEEVVDLVDACCKPSLRESNANIETVFEAIEAWAEISFRKESRSPLLQTVAEIVEAIRGGISALKTSSTLNSLNSSAQGSTGETSLNANADGHTGDGPSPSSDQPSSPPDETAPPA